MKPQYSLSALLIGSIVATSVLPATAASLTFSSFSGTLGSDDSVSLFDFRVDASSRVGIKTLSYGGGLLADGTNVAPGGFDPILTLFDSNNNFLSSNDDRGGRFDPATSAAYDSRIVRSLDPGTYTVAVSQYNNFHNGSNGNPPLAGFQRQGEPNFTASDFGCAAGQFCDVTGDSRTNRWIAEVPEPSTILGSGLMLGMLGMLRRWRLRKA